MLLSCLAQAHQLPFALAHITAEGQLEDIVKHKVHSVPAR